MLWIAAILSAYTVHVFDVVRILCGSYYELSHWWPLCIIRHNELRVFKLNYFWYSITSVFWCVLQILSGETLTYSTAIAEDEVHLKDSADEFYGGRHQRVFLMSGYSNQLLHHACGYHSCVLSGWKQKIWTEVVALVFFTFGGISGCTNVVYKCLAYLLSCLKRGMPYSSVMAWLCCCMSFSLLHSVIDSTLP